MKSAFKGSATQANDKDHLCRALEAIQDMISTLMAFFGLYVLYFSPN